MKKKFLAIILSLSIALTSLAAIFSVNIVAGAEGITYERDEEWYDPDKSVLQINDIPDFIEFMYQLEEQGTADNGAALGYTGNIAAISWEGKMPFEGQTILLNTDIVLNSGIRFTATGPSSSDAYCFVRNNKQIGFGGIFDGQGHTISGLYISSTKGTGGSIFGVAGAAAEYPTTNVTVKNLQIKNSYISSSARGVATIFASAAFNANARIENVYSNAYLHHTLGTDAPVVMGGLCANVGGTLTIDNCVYAGAMTAETEGATENKKYFGGFVGMTSTRKLNDDKTYYGVVNVQSSAFYGTLVNDMASYVGKVVGQKTASDANCPEPTVTVEGCILAGNVQTKTGTALGAIAGEITSNVKVLILDTVYTPIQSNSTDVTVSIGAKTDSVTITGSPTKVTDASLVGDKSASGLGNGLDTYWVSNSDVSGYPLPLGVVSTFSEESLKHDFVTPLADPTAELLDALGAKKNNEGEYTNSSYEEYSSAYGKIVNAINSGNSEYSVDDILSLKENAEAWLVTVEEARTNLLASLGEKIINDDLYTDESYAEYTSAYDDIVAAINSAGSDIESIDVLSLKTIAEAKLQMLPNDEKTTITEQGGSASVNITVNYLGTSNLNTVYSVDVIWDDISFTYDAGSMQWDPEAHDYVSEEREAGWSDASGKITVINHSNADVNIDVTFDKSNIVNGNADLSIATPSFTLNSAVGTAVADAPKNSTEIYVVGVPERNGPIGKLTVTVSKHDN